MCGGFRSCPSLFMRPGPSRSSLALVVIWLVVGCRKDIIRSEKAVEPTVARLLAIAYPYQQYTFDHGRPPKTFADIANAVVSKNPLLSPRDNKPFVIFWDVDVTTPQAWATGRPILAHESRGVDGRRYALTTLLNVELLSDEEFHASSFPPAR